MRMRPTRPTRPAPPGARTRTCRKHRAEWAGATSMACPPDGRFALAEIIVGGPDRPRRRPVRIEVFLGDDGNAAVFAHLDKIDPSRAARIHPVAPLELRHHTLDGALHAERLVAADAAERLFLLQDPCRRS